MEFPGHWGYPETLGYVTWSLTMIPCSLFALWLIDWKLEYDLRSVLLGSVVGFTGAGGQLILFIDLRQGPAYIIFPIVSLYPVVSIFLSVLLLKEKISRKSVTGVALAMVAVFMLAYQPPSANHASSYLWLVLAISIFVMWGIQAYVMKFSNQTMKAESIFFYMMLTGILLDPIALAMTDFSQPINFSFKGPGATALIQQLNSIGALTIVYALRHGKALIVVPMTSLAPLITIVLSLCIYLVLPHWVTGTGMAVATAAIYLLAME